MTSEQRPHNPTADMRPQPINNQSGLVLNALPLGFDNRAPMQVGRLPYNGAESFDRLRREQRGSHVLLRSGDSIETVAVRQDVELLGEVKDIEAGGVPKLLAALLSEWLIGHFTGLGKQVFRQRRTLVLVSGKEEDNLLRRILPRGFSAPAWLGFRAAYKLEVRAGRIRQGPYVHLLLDAVAKPSLDASIAELLEMNVPVENLYVRRSVADDDSRLAQGGRLTGRIVRVVGDKLELSDNDEGWASILASDARLEPRLEVLARVIACLQRCPDDASAVLERLRAVAGTIAAGKERLNRLRSLAAYLQQKPITLTAGLSGKFGGLLASKGCFPAHEFVPKPVLIFDPSGRRTNRWNQGGLDQHGPFDRYQFNPKHLNIAVICRRDLQGRVEQFVQQLLHGVPGTRGGEIGFLRRFALEKPYVQVFAANDGTAASYREAAVAAIEQITDQGQNWNLVLVQTEEAMEVLEGDANAYLVSKAFFLARGIAVQHVHFETINQPVQQRAYSLNNIGLACYAKLGGVPWLLPSDQTVSHELVIGLGSHQEKTSRFGVGDRFVGVTTVFSGDGRYLLESRTRAVPYEDYGAAMLEAVRAAVGHVRQDFAWAATDPVRLVFHVFKPVKDAEARAVRDLMSELALPHAEFAFLHIADEHPFRVFSEDESGVTAAGGSRKGVYAPPRGLLVHLSGPQTPIKDGALT